MRSFFILAVPAALASESEVCASDGTCAQDEATLLQMHGLRAKLEAQHKQTPANQIQGCPNSRVDEYVGGNVRCCSLDGSTCNSGYFPQSVAFGDGSSSDGRPCGAGDCNGDADAWCHDDVSFHQAAQICRDNGERLCTQAEVEGGVCCGTGCMHNHHNIWFSDAANPSPPFDGWGQYQVDRSKCNYNENLVCVDSHEECQGVAIANGHDWYSFRHNIATNNECNGRHKCFSSAHCNEGLFGDRVNEWKIYKNTGYTLDGCSTDGADLFPLTENSGGEVADVRCCSLDGSSGASQGFAGGEDYFRPGATTAHSTGCMFQKTFTEAQGICAAAGMRLCAPHEVDVTCGSGCWHNHAAVWVDVPTVGVTIDGCSTDNSNSNPDGYPGSDNSGALIPSAQRAEGDMAAVRCCSSASGNACDSEVDGTCNDAVTFVDAQRLCSLDQKRLCSASEMDNCCGTGCWYNHFSVWTSSGL